MTSTLDPARLLRAARERAGLTQRELARRARTSQSVVARIELGHTSPSLATLTRLLQAGGFELRGEIEASPVIASHMLDEVSRILSLTPEERLREIANLSRLETDARRV